MLIRKLIEIRNADAELPPETRAALIHSLFAPISSLAIGAINGSIIGMAVALSVGNRAILADLDRYSPRRHGAGRIRDFLPALQAHAPG